MYIMDSKSLWLAYITKIIYFYIKIWGQFPNSKFVRLSSQCLWAWILTGTIFPHVTPVVVKSIKTRDQCKFTTELKYFFKPNE